MGYYATIKKEELNLLHVCDKMDGPWIYFAELSQAERNKNCIISLISKILKKKTNLKFIDTKENRWVVARVMGWGKDDLGERDQRYKLPVIN